MATAVFVLIGVGLVGGSTAAQAASVTALSSAETSTGAGVATDVDVRDESSSENIGVEAVTATVTGTTSDGAETATTTVTAAPVSATDAPTPQSPEEDSAAGQTASSAETAGPSDAADMADDAADTAGKQEPRSSGDTAVAAVPDSDVVTADKGTTSSASVSLNTAQVCVKDSTKGNPVSSIIIDLYGWTYDDWNWIDSKTTNSKGCATFTLPSDVSNFTARANSDSVRVGSGLLDGLTQFPSNNTGSGARTQPAANGLALTWGTIVMPSLNQVKGVVVNDQGKAVVGAQVFAYSWYSGQRDWTTYLGDVVTTAGGKFTIGVPQGVIYTLWVSATGYVDGWLGNKGEPAATGLSAGTRLSPPKATSSPTDLSSSPIVLNRLAQVSGKVVDLTGKPIADAAVNVVRWDSDGTEIFNNDGDTCTDTAANGSFTCSVMPGDRFTLVAQQDGYADGWLGNKGEPANAKASTVQPALAAGASRSVGTITLGQPNTARVRVTDSKGDPVSTTIDLYAWYEGQGWLWSDMTDTDASGYGEFLLPSDATVFTVQAEADGVNAPAYLDGLAGLPSSNSGKGTRAQPAGGPASGGQTLNWTIVMPVGNSVTGAVVDDISQPVPNAYVDLYLWDSDFQEWDWTVEVRAGSQGQFSMSGIPAGATYALYAYADDDHYLDGWSGNQGQPESEKSVGVMVAPSTLGQTAALVQPIVLQRLIQVSGTVVTPDGQPYAGGPLIDDDGDPDGQDGATVTVYVWRDGQWVWWDQEVTTTDGGAGGLGTYTTLIPAGSQITVEADPTNGDTVYVTGWAGGLAYGPTSPTGPGVITVTTAAGATSQQLAPVALQDASVAISLAASGRVVDGDGNPVAGVLVDASNAAACEGDGCVRYQSWGPATTDSDGFYTISGISIGSPYLVRAQLMAGPDSDVDAFGFMGNSDPSCAWDDDDPIGLYSYCADTVWGDQPNLPDIVLYVDILFDENGGDFTSWDANTEVWPALNTPIGPLPTDLSRDGYEFTGWNTKPDGTGAVVTADTVATHSMTVYAQWQPLPATGGSVLGKTGGSGAGKTGGAVTGKTGEPTHENGAQVGVGTGGSTFGSSGELGIAAWLLILAATLACWRTLRTRRSSRASR